MNPKGLLKSTQLSNSVHCVTKHTPCAFKKEVPGHEEWPQLHHSLGKRSDAPQYSILQQPVYFCTWNHYALCGGKELSPPSPYPSAHTCLSNGFSQDGLDKGRSSPVLPQTAGNAAVVLPGWEQAKRSSRGSQAAQLCRLPTGCIQLADSSWDPETLTSNDHHYRSPK